MTFLQKNSKSEADSNGKNGSSNGSNNGAIVKTGDNPAPTIATGSKAIFLPPATLEQPVIYERSVLWSRFVIWFIISIVVGAVGWSYFAQIEEAVPAMGKLETEKPVKDVQAPTGGVIKELKIKPDQKVKKGDLLVVLDPAVPKAERDALLRTKSSLDSEIQFYSAQLNNFEVEGSDVLGTPKAFLTTQQQLLAASQTELRSRTETNRQEVNQLETQLAQAQQQIDNQKKIIAQNQLIIAQSLQNLEINQKILSDLKPVAESGALPMLQFRQQQQRVITSKSEIESRQTETLRSQAEIDRLGKEQMRIEGAIAQSKQRLQNSISQTSKEILQRIAELQKRQSEVDGQLIRAEQNLKYQEIRSPIDGTVFDLKYGEGNVISGVNATTAIMKIVPSDGLVANVFILNKDIGFVKNIFATKKSLPVEVAIDSFPKLEYGGVEGKLVAIGSDALPPDAATGRQFYAFPAKIKLNTQSLNLKCKNPGSEECVKLPLQAGMSVNTNIIIGKRRVINIFLGQFVDKADALKNVR
jgi:hemolysin D